MIGWIFYLWFIPITYSITDSGEGYFDSLYFVYDLDYEEKDAAIGVHRYARNWIDLEGAVLFEHNCFEGESVTIKNYKNQSCINFHRSNISTTNFNNFISSVQRSGSTSCFYAYASIGCIGPSFKFDDEKTSRDCAPDLIRCNMNDKISSISFCNTSLSEVYDKPMGLKGTPCRDNCTTGGENYFWCHLEDGKKDYCSPRPGIDPFGNSCGDDCRKEINGKPILYQFENFRGRGFEIDNPDGKTCLSMRYHNDSDGNYDNRASSVDIGLSCIILHEHIGCTGKQLKLSFGDAVNCHKDLTD
ncbi:unnamed protein product [Allacma fusca]|uniref:Uncharacterized protein n=1 Tax=Allacma fusca TaxID=39272 RepID=A0A8J2KYW9_9HEXA|nr:unnamed protein product [Allacma fusca]